MAYKLKLASVALLTLVGCTTPISDTKIPVVYQDIYGSADANNDGFFSLAEVNACASGSQVTEEQKEAGVLVTQNNFTEAQFEAADENKDQQLSVDELIRLLDGGQNHAYGYGLTQCGEVPEPAEPSETPAEEA